jgi:acyl-coenzyme A thioesterase PaaI-like protein
MATLYRVEVTYDGDCFGCGENNQRGLKMRFLDQGGESVCEYAVAVEYQSWRGLVHGGVIALMLDEAVGWAGWHAGHPGLTGKLEVRYRLPLRIGERVRVVGRVERIRRSLVYAVSYIERFGDGARIAEATATLMEAPATVT